MRKIWSIFISKQVWQQLLSLPCYAFSRSTCFLLIREALPFGSGLGVGRKIESNRLSVASTKSFVKMNSLKLKNIWVSSGHYFIPVQLMSYNVNVFDFVTFTSNSMEKIFIYFFQVAIVSFSSTDGQNSNEGCVHSTALPRPEGWSAWARPHGENPDGGVGGWGAERVVWAPDLLCTQLQVQQTSWASLCSSLKWAWRARSCLPHRVVNKFQIQ